MKKKLTFLAVCLALCCALCSCGPKTTLNGIDLSQFTIVYDPSAPDYCQRAAIYIQEQIQGRTGVKLAVEEAGETSYPHELLVGETNRPLSAQLNADTKGGEFAILADDNHIALEGDYFLIAAAAYYFVQTYICEETFQSTVPKEVTVSTPIAEDANNFILLIGDGMGPMHIKLLSALTPPEYTETDGENLFYGDLLPYQGFLHTNSKSGVTDSAAAATALSCGYKTQNGRIGQSSDGRDLLSITELCAMKGKATAVMSTEASTGATPAGFSAHADSRDNSKAILETQRKLEKDYGTLINCDNYSVLDYIITDTLDELEQDEDGFFIMYEEAHIDKESHGNNLEGVQRRMSEFNQAIGIFMEHAFYHPDTLVIITADHETGGLTQGKDGEFFFTSTGHTGTDVCVFAYGNGAEYFGGCEMENTQVPKLLAKMMGQERFGD